MKCFASFGLDTSNQCLWHQGERIALQPKPFSVLCYLVDHPGRLITHNELLDALWPETFVQPQVLRTYVLELSKILGDDARAPRFIESVPKRGYRFLAELTDTGFSGAAGSSGGLVGRSSELCLLIGAFERAREGRRQCVFVTGDSGIGKTALLDAFCAGFEPSVAATITRGQCVQGLSHKDEYYPFMEALAQLCASFEGEQACSILARFAPGWLAALGRCSGPAAPVARAPGDLCSALEELAREKPLLLVLDDLHWADDSTLDLVSALARRRANARVMVLASLNPQHPGTSTQLLRLKQDLAMHRLGAEVALTPLPKTAVAELLTFKLGASASTDFVEFVHRYAEGNPLFVNATIDHLIAQGLLHRVESSGRSGWQQRIPISEMELTVPDELAQMIELEIQSLPMPDQRLLEAASLFPVVFPAWGVGAALNEDFAEIEEACDALARRLFFVRRAGHDELPDGSRSAFYAFAHGLYREVLYQRQSPARRAQRHTRLAERLATLFAGREVHVAHEIAAHHEAAGNWLRAIRALQMTAAAALGRSSSAEAAQILNHAVALAANLTEPERTSVEAEIRLALATADIKPALPAGPNKSTPVEFDEFWTTT